MKRSPGALAAVLLSPLATLAAGPSRAAPPSEAAAPSQPSAPNRARAPDEARAPDQATVPNPAMPPSEAAMSDLRRRWQGNWIVRDAEYPGSIQAWSVDGDSVTVYDPITHRSQSEKFTLKSPCRLVRSQSVDTGEGQTVLTTNTFAFAPDGLHVAPSKAGGGERRGAILTACVGDHVYTFDTGTQQCRKWNETMSGEPTPAAGCALDAFPPSLVLRQIGEATEDVRLNLEGDALLSSGLDADVTERQPSFGAARKRADALVSEPGLH